MLFNALHNLSFFFKNLGLLEFTPIPCSSLSPNLSHLHCKIVYSSAKLLWKVRPETISASTCFPKLAPFKKQASPPFRNKTLEAANQKFCSFHFTAFCFQLLLSLISHFLLLFSLLPLSFDPSLLWLAELFPWGLHQGTSFLVLKKQAAQSWHSPVMSPPSFNQKNFQERKNERKMSYVSNQKPDLIQELYWRNRWFSFHFQASREPGSHFRAGNF